MFPRSLPFILISLWFAIPHFVRQAWGVESPSQEVSFASHTTPSDAAPLRLDQAIRSAIRNNLSNKLASAASETARAEALQAAASLLPRINGTISQSRVFKTNLAALGFPSNNPSFPSLIGPYNVFDARISLVQSVLDFSAIYTARAGIAARRVAELQETLAREQVAAATAIAYFEAQRTARAVTAAQADLKLSQSLLKLARDQHTAGVATGVDVARSETNSAQENLRLIRSQVAAQGADIRLKRLVGLPLNQLFTLPELPRVPATPLSNPDDALAKAFQDRPEMRIASETFQASIYNYRSVEAQNLPTVKATADYGFSGNTLNGTARTSSIGGHLDLPIFEGGRIRGKTRAARALRDQYESRYHDIRDQVEEDVRLSLQTLEAEIQETHIADQVVQFAQRELKMARDRYGAGVGDNIQLLSAQDVLDRALDDQVDALARYDTARVNFATSLGQMENFK